MNIPGRNSEWLKKAHSLTWSSVMIIHIPQQNTSDNLDRNLAICRHPKFDNISDIIDGVLSSQASLNFDRCQVKLSALKGGVLPNGSASQPGEDFFNFR